MEAKSEERKITVLDIKIMISVAICALTATTLNYFGLKFHYGEMQLEIIQKMAACISCFLVCQEQLSISSEAGKNRLIITAVGGLIGIVAVGLDMLFGQNQWMMIVWIMLGVLATLFFCKVCKVPYINARIGGVTFILVACTLSGNARIYYSIFRFISTLYAVIVVLLVTWVFEIIKRSKW